MARRRPGREDAIELGLRAAPVIFVSLMLHALAFIVWDIGSRSPAHLFADVQLALSSPRTLTKGLWRLFFGALLLIVGALLMLSVTVADIRTEFAVLETGAVLVGLLLEMLVGEPIRTHLANR